MHPSTITATNIDLKSKLRKRWYTLSKKTIEISQWFANKKTYLNNFAPQQKQLYSPSSKCLSYLPVKARSVPASRVTLYSNGLIALFHSSALTSFGSLFLPSFKITPPKRTLIELIIHVSIANFTKAGKQTILVATLVRSSGMSPVKWRSKHPVELGRSDLLDSLNSSLSLDSNRSWWCKIRSTNWRRISHRRSVAQAKRDVLFFTWPLAYEMSGLMTRLVGH